MGIIEMVCDTFYQAFEFRKKFNMHANVGMKICATHKLAQNARESRNEKVVKQFLSKYDFLKKKRFRVTTSSCVFS